jgi:hypothetical protein
MKKLTEILKIKGTWEDVVNRCRATVGKDELGKEPSSEFKKAILIAEHSPIRELHISWAWRCIKSWVATHWVRHVWECYVKTQRDDRTGIPRDDLPQGALVDFFGEMNPQHSIDTWRKRLCFLAHPRTREYAVDFKAELHEFEPEWSDVLVPNCIYRGGCPEMNGGCKWYQQMILKHPFLASTDIQRLYDEYNKIFWSGRR